MHAQIFIDGLHPAGGWTLLVAGSTAHVITRQWAASESTAAHTTLLRDPATAARTGRTWWYPTPAPAALTGAWSARPSRERCVRPPDRLRGRAPPHTPEEGLWTRKGWAGRTR